MKKLLAIVGALVTGGLTVMIANTIQLAEAGIKMN
jgi:hypothetical protein